MVQTSPTSHADRLYVPGATAVRVLGVLLILEGTLRLVAAMMGVVQAFQRAINVNYIVFSVIVLAVLGLVTVNAGILLFRRECSGRLFALVVCSIALAYQLLSLGSISAYLYLLAQSPPPSLGMVFWAMNVGSIILFLMGIIVIARWHPPRVAGY